MVRGRKRHIAEAPPDNCSFGIALEDQCHQNNMVATVDVINTDDQKKTVEMESRLVHRL